MMKKEMSTIAYLLIIACASRADTGPLAVQARVRPGAYYVGQAVDLSVSVVAGVERPAVTPPAVPGVEVAFVKDDPLRPISVSGIGEVVSQKALFRSHFRLIARRAGPVRVPPISARLGNKTGASAPLTVQIRDLPEAGRTGDFLGGVGPFEVDARVEPAAVRPGQVLEYRVSVEGPAARGGTAAPSVARLERSPLGFRIERRPDQAVSDPPSRTYVYRLWPTRVGQTTLPPVSIAAFDPQTGRYVTKVTPSLPVRVADAPRFDPDSLTYEPHAVGTVARTGGNGARIAWLAVGAGAAAAVGFGIRGARRSDTVRARRLCRGVCARLGRSLSDAEAGRTIRDGLVAYLALTSGRPTGALTPYEAGREITRASASDELGGRALRLMTDCDRVLYAGGWDNGGDLRKEGMKFFRQLGVAGVSGRAGGGPGMAGAGGGTH